MNEQILTAVETALRRAEVLRPEATLLVALSGGADSVALLRAVCQLMEVHGFAVRAAHVEHGLRGEASEEDARFCSRLCAGLGIPCTVDHAALSGDMAAPGVENRARDARYRLLLLRARECRADALLFAHHRDDQAETVLAHLIRGSGARGLGAMREQTRVEGLLVLRPLLGLSKAELLAAMEGVTYRVDESNREPCCQRNRLRAEVMPMLAAENPRAAEHMAQSAQLLAMDEDVLGAMAEDCFRGALVNNPPLLCARRAAIMAAPDAVAVRALRRFAALGARLWNDARVNAAGTGEPVASAGRAVPGVSRPVPDFRETAQTGAAGGAPPLMPALQGFASPEGEQSLSAGDSLKLLRLLRAAETGSMNLPHGLRIDATPRYLHLVRMADGSPVTAAAVPSPVGLAPLCAPSPRPAAAALCAQQGSERRVRFGVLTLRLSPFDPTREPAPDGRLSVAVPDALLARATLRTARAGDRFRPFGAEGGKPLRRYCTDRHIDLPFRPLIPLICIGQEVLWAAGVGAAESTRLTGEPATRITAEGDLPWFDPTPRKAARQAEA